MFTLYNLTWKIGSVGNSLNLSLSVSEIKDDTFKVVLLDMLFNRTQARYLLNKQSHELHKDHSFGGVRDVFRVRITP